MSSDRSLRSSQLVSPYGPGAIVDIGDESLLLTDLADWPKKLDVIEMPRLTSELRVRALKAPPKNPELGRPDVSDMIKTIRFPRWMFCPSCRRLEEWKNETGLIHNKKPVCQNPRCKKRALVPMRFVAACESGHLSDIPWDFWAHSGLGRKGSCKQNEARLFFRTDSKKGSGLDALYVQCDECGSKRNLGDITHAGTLSALNVKCHGSQPWEKWKTCDSPLVALQRGASNLYYPIVRSALDIPDGGGVGSGSSELLECIKLHSDFVRCQVLLDKGKEGSARDLADFIAEDCGCSVDDVINVMAGKVDERGDHRIPGNEVLQLAEWAVLSSNNIEQQSSRNFSARVEEERPKIHWGLNRLIKRVVLLDKLREVRAFCGYERVKPGIAVVPPAGRHSSIKWLPAVQVFGEGIFIELDQSVLSQWQKTSRRFIDSRIVSMVKKHAEGKVSYLPLPTPELVALHTFAHMLIRQLSFECGYSSGSIRERIYAESGQAGILIYTADSDSEGSLGGLVQQGELKRLYPVIAAALDQASWCSNDPVCSEMETQGVMGLNKAACHSCTLVSETSCTMNNLLLDRKLVLGDENGSGLFTDVLNRIKEGRQLL